MNNVDVYKVCNVLCNKITLNVVHRAIFARTKTASDGWIATLRDNECNSSSKLMQHSFFNKATFQ